jgi:3-mercaptopyruvate sulfurtransferase SseA
MDRQVTAIVLRTASKSACSGRSFARRARPIPLIWFAMVLCGLLTGCRPVEPVTDADFPARGTVNFEGLVSAHWVKRVLDFQASGFRLPRPETCRTGRFVVLEAGWGALEQAREYRTGHLPGAVYFDTDELETGYPTWRLRELTDLQRAIGQAGIDTSTTVIVYGRKVIAAARIWWVLKYAGVADVRLLDGGFAAWESAGYPVDREIPKPLPVAFAGPVADHWLATTDYVRERLGSARIRLADVRSSAEFTGRTSGYSYLDASGRIPSAIPIGDGDDAAHLYVQRDGRLRPPTEILQGWQRNGLQPAASGTQFEQEVIFYCGGGWRSSLAFFYAWLLGMGNIRNYSDGWGGWSTEYQRDPTDAGSTPGWRQIPTGNPIESGPVGLSAEPPRSGL